MVTGGCWCSEVVGDRAAGGGVRECERRELPAACCPWLCCCVLLLLLCATAACCVRSGEEVEKDTIHPLLGVLLAIGLGCEFVYLILAAVT